MKASSKAGRPQGDSDVRARLIEAARQLFTDHPYEKVTTRMLAEHAAVNIAMIRYYFGNKSGLFLTMITEVTAPIRHQLEQALEEANVSNITAILSRFYQIMGENPSLPNLLYRIMTMPEDSELRAKLIESEGRSNLPQKIFKALEQGGCLQPGINPAMTWLSLHCLMFYPFLLMPIVKSMGFDMSRPEFLEQLAAHNTHLLARGLLKDEVETP